MKGQSDEDGERILLGDNTRSGRVTLWPLTLQCVWVWIWTGRSFI